MCDVVETGIGREISCADKRRTVLTVLELWSTTVFCPTPL